MPLLSSAAGAVNGVLRLTEQGEAVQQSYGIGRSR